MDKKEVEKIKAETKHEEEISPIMDFSQTEQYPDDYEEQAKIVKKHIISDLISKFSEFCFGVFLIFVTPMLGMLGSVTFIAAIFFMIPDGGLKTIVYLYRLKHYKDYVEHRDFRINKNYIRLFMDSLNKRNVFSKKSHEDSE